MTPGLSWMLAGLALCAADLLHPGVFLLWIGLAALGAGLVTAAEGFAFAAQVATFLLLLAISLAVPVLRRRRTPVYDGGVNAPGRDVLGKTCRALAFDGAEGRVSLRDGTWSARLAAGPPPAPGATLHVVGLEGTTLIVSAERPVPD